jgi:hypothetical protein
MIFSGFPISVSISQRDFACHKLAQKPVSERENSIGMVGGNGGRSAAYDVATAWHVFMNYLLSGILGGKCYQSSAFAVSSCIHFLKISGWKVSFVCTKNGNFSITPG